MSENFGQKKNKNYSFYFLLLLKTLRTYYLHKNSTACNQAVNLWNTKELNEFSYIFTFYFYARFFFLKENTK